MINFDQLLSELTEVPQVNGIVPVDILNLPQPVGKIVRGMVRDKRITAVELGEALELPVDQASQVAEILLEKGYLYVVDEANSVEAESESDNRGSAESRAKDNGSKESSSIESSEQNPNALDVYKIRFARMRRQNIPLDL